MPTANSKRTQAAYTARRANAVRSTATSRLQLDNTTYAGDQSVTNTFINTPDSYRRANESVGINAINANTDAPVLIYNTGASASLSYIN